MEGGREGGREGEREGGWVGGMERPRAGCGRHEMLSELSSSLVRKRSQALHRHTGLGGEGNETMTQESGEFPLSLKWQVNGTQSCSAMTTESTCTRECEHARLEYHCCTGRSTRTMKIQYFSTE